MGNELKMFGRDVTEPAVMDSLLGCFGMDPG